MATFANVFQPVARVHLPSLRALLAHWSEIQSRRRLRGRIVRDLNAHSDRQLADMGFARTDIRAVARGTYRR